MLYLLDTDHISLLGRGGVEGERIRARLRLLAPDDYGISIITFSEQMKGWLAEVARANSPQTEAVAFGKMQTGLSLCSAFALWEYNLAAATRCDALKKMKLRVGTQDLRIAAIALEAGAIVVTRNTRDFGRVPGLPTENWAD